MPLWGKSPTSDAKPKYLSAEDKLNTYATSRGWVFKRPDGTEEVLVAIGGLGALLTNADVTDVFFANTAASYVQANANAFVTVAFNEVITVTGSPTIRVDGSVANATATYISGSGTNKLQFKFTVPSQTQTLSLTAQTITLSGGTLVDGTSTAANTTIEAGDVKGVRGKVGANSQVAVA